MIYKPKFLSWCKPLAEKIETGTFTIGEYT